MTAQVKGGSGVLPVHPTQAIPHGIRGIPLFYMVTPRLWGSLRVLPASLECPCRVVCPEDGMAWPVPTVPKQPKARTTAGIPFDIAYLDG